MTDHGASGPGRTRLDDLLDRARLHARLDVHRARVDRARDRVELLPDRPVVSWSGGKDSTVVAHLVRQLRPQAVIAHLDSGIDFPETTRYVTDLTAAHGWDLRVHHADPDALELMRRMGAWDHHADDVTVDVSDWYRPLDTIARDLDGVAVWGLRAAESRRRHALLTRTRGRYTRADGLTVTHPIWDWRDLDVYAYHAAHDLPLNPVYGRLADLGAPEEAWRVDAMVSSGGGMRRGRYTWLRRGWPAEWARLAAVLPRLREMS